MANKTEGAVKSAICSHLEFVIAASNKSDNPILMNVLVILPNSLFTLGGAQCRCEAVQEIENNTHTHKSLAASNLEERKSSDDASKSGLKIHIANRPAKGDVVGVLTALNGHNYWTFRETGFMFDI